MTSWSLTLILALFHVSNCTRISFFLIFLVNCFEILLFPRSKSISESDYATRFWHWSTITSENVQSHTVFPISTPLCVYLENVCIESMFQKAGGSDDEALLWFEGEPRRRWMVLSLRRTEQPAVLLLIHPQRWKWERSSQRSERGRVFAEGGGDLKSVMSATSVSVFNWVSSFLSFFGGVFTSPDVWLWGTSVSSDLNDTCELAGWALNSVQPSRPLSSTVCQTFYLLTSNSPSIRLWGPLIGSWGGKAYSWSEPEECRFVSVAPNQSSAGKLKWVPCDLLTDSMKGVICPSVHSFIDKPHWLAWQRHLRWRIRSMRAHIVLAACFRGKGCICGDKH